MLLPLKHHPKFLLKDPNPLKLDGQYTQLPQKRRVAIKNIWTENHPPDNNPHGPIGKQQDLKPVLWE